MMETIKLTIEEETLDRLREMANSSYSSVEDFIGDVLQSISHSPLKGESIICMMAAAIASPIFADLVRRGPIIGYADTMIADLALRHRLTPVTGNLAHHRRIHALGYDLKLENWRD